MSENKNLKEIVKFDYFKFNKKRWFPDFLLRDVDKTLERNLRNAKERNIINIPYEKYYLESFKIDIINFLNSGVVNEGNFYLIFDENIANNILDITLAINENLLMGKNQKSASFRYH